MTGSGPTALEEAVGICEAAAGEGITVRLAGGLAIQYLTPEFPPRGGDRQDLDLGLVKRSPAADPVPDRQGICRGQEL